MLCLASNGWYNHHPQRRGVCVFASSLLSHIPSLYCTSICESALWKISNRMHSLVCLILRLLRRLYLESEGRHGLTQGSQDSKEIDGGHGGAVALLIQQPGHEGDAQEAKGRNDIGKGCIVVCCVAFVLQLKTSSSQIKLHTNQATLSLCFNSRLTRTGSMRETGT